MLNAKGRGLWTTSSVLLVLSLASFIHLQDSNVSSASTLNVFTKAPAEIPVTVAPASAALPNSASTQQTRIGPMGLQGKTGAQGSAGTPGSQGSTGTPGPQGPVGISGLQGIAGAAGAIGLQGPVGTDGATGAQGVAGAIGLQGNAGVAGALGSIGAVGPQGPAGDPGPQGPAGEGIPKGYIEQRFCYDAKTLVVTFGECANKEIGINLIWLISDPVKG